MVSANAAQFWEDGACLVRNAITTTELAAARAAVDSVTAADELADLSALVDSDETPRFKAGVDHWRTHDEFLRLATTGSIPAVVARILDTDRLWLYEDSVLVKEAGSTVPTRWHTDDGYFHVEGDQLATVWLALDPSPRAAGSLRFVRGSHRADTRYRPTLFVTDDPIPKTSGAPAPTLDLDDQSVFGWDLVAGDLTIHHARTLHAAEGNSTPCTRRALSIRYCGVATVVQPKPGAPAKMGMSTVSPGTPMAVAAEVVGLPEAILT